MTDTFLVRVRNKSYVFIRTESGRFFDITGCYVLTDGHIDKNDVLVPDAKQVSVQYVADLTDKSVRAKVKRSKIRRLRKEEAV